jgi:hypothetical protein
MLKQYTAVFTFTVFRKTKRLADLNTTSLASLEANFLALRLDIELGYATKQNKLKNLLRTFARRLRISLNLTIKTQLLILP